MFGWGERREVGEIPYLFAVDSSVELEGDQPTAGEIADFQMAAVFHVSEVVPKVFWVVLQR